MFDKTAFAGHESVHHFFDAKTGLRAIIAIHSTVRGPAGGGCRMWNYATADEALVDALRLSEGMSYKNAMADLPLGGGKAVIWGNSKTGNSLVRLCVSTRTICGIIFPAFFTITQSPTRISLRAISSSL